jgi:hypothetical protein
MLHSNSVLKGTSFELGSNSGDKDDASNEILQNLGSSMKFRKKSRYLLHDFNDTEIINPAKLYGTTNANAKPEVFDALMKVKQSQASKNIIK